ncbi:methyl-accepting chemotaxis protein [Paucibacter sediminis]|uniref:Methyl-accepting chemotaxis protein n=1 Tax=Paucibacter sediminis TaxID=3019553 RepID=A0AA95NEP5_9BURK|nr:methyl-accepting chemotaxis protein [Paucibacter sp. S2-9]WIT13692.1 methyl-accepting chemotaxis protein [Paucibacter sp. S2-9]
MQALRNRSIATRLRLGFALLILVSMAVALFGRLALSQVGLRMQALTEQHLVVVGLLGQIKDNVNVTARAARNIALLSDAAAKQAEKAVIDANRNDTRGLLKQLEDRLAAEAGGALLKQVTATRQAYVKVMDQAISEGLAGHNEAARDLLVGEVSQTQTAYFGSLNELVKLQRQRMDEAKQEADATIARAGLAMLGLLGLAAMCGLVIANWLARSVTRPLLAAVQVTQRIARGDLSSRIVAESDDEVGQLSRSLHAMQEALRSLVGVVRASSDSVATGAGQIAVGNGDLSQRTERQASSLQQTAASMEQLSGTVLGSAETARQANAFAAVASGAAERGAAVVGQVITTMDGINAASRRIGDIVGVIDGIAFQTNILALNAAVEAARAGEQGRGFAVVAAEVRNLAQRSASAAREIKSLIATNESTVEAGSRLVGEAGHSMRDIHAQVARVVGLIGELGAAAEAQSRDIVQINQAVAQLDESTQQNAALVEQSAAAADSLSQQARVLVDAVSAFRLELA